MVADTIFALSSGAPPAAIAVVRISGPRAGVALERLAGGIPLPRAAKLSRLRDSAGALLDEALILWFPGPRSETGEDCAELQLHGGRAVVEAVCNELATIEGFRPARAGEFTRRAFANGQIDLLQVEGLADLVMAETEMQRRAAIGVAGGSLSREVEGWLARVLALSAQVEAVLDFDEEGDVDGLGDHFERDISGLVADLRNALAAPRAEMLRDGYRVALAGPPNAGKSTLFNRLLEEEAAIVSPAAGTTRDVLVRNIAVGGVPITLVDMAGLRDEGGDVIEEVGIGRARAELGRADLILWLGPEGEGPPGAWEVEAQIDRPDRAPKSVPDHRLSAVTGEGVVTLWQAIEAEARSALGGMNRPALARRQRSLIEEAAEALAACEPNDDPLLVAENLRLARAAFDRLTGKASTEDMLNSLFGRFCVGK
ncbi:tRNA uridine-5-carboxymethylaminomethyl(34) synthesis GTPase MnmE [Croceibacterium aestuarii]|uniref:tRNA uridine-5-carboxymethylaminomethyl(34) synthesis GTPase MnmE n=1 Tax=Croceibacterium aestuarii TaxID=3064139 RepID=UPI00272E44DA|nr:tRNA uridine-5-carboxymethylaminomethyl(34) synthesis GTPase MnmE [Croceibacterium sp. D39]